MEVPFTCEEEQQLAQIAMNVGVDAARLVRDSALRLLRNEAELPAIARGSVVAEMRALRSRIKADPEGWTTRDYVQYGRR